MVKISRIISHKNKFSTAFTLIELLVVISIIGLLSSVVIASVTAARKQGMIAAGQKFDAHTHAAFYDDLVLSWDFDRDTAGSGVVQDLSGNGNNMAYKIPSVLSVLSPFKTGKSFNSLGAEIAKTGTLVSGNIVEAGLNKAPAGSFAISFWLYPTSAQDTNYIHSLSGINDKGWRFSYSISAFNFTYVSNGGKTAVAGSLALNSWHHIVSVCDTGKLAVYVNGKIAGTKDTGAVTCGFISNIPVKIGNNSLAFNIDNVRIYSKSLPVSSIQGLYLADLPEFQSVAKNVIKKDASYEN